MLSVIATIVRYRKGETIYQEGAEATHVFNISTGLVKSYKTLPEGRHMVGFLFPGDLVGLAADGRYVNSAEALTSVTLYKLPVGALEARLRRSPGLEFQVICKLCHELRKTQRHAYLLSRHRAAARVGLLLQMLEVHEVDQGGMPEAVHLPMTRADIGAYVGISPEAVTRALRELARRGAIALRDRRHITIIDRARLEESISEQSTAREV